MSEQTLHAEGARQPTPTAANAPVAGTERIDAIDKLRGIAVAGILVMNIYGFAMPFMAYSNPLAHGGTEWYNMGTWFSPIYSSTRNSCRFFRCCSAPGSS